MQLLRVCGDGRCFFRTVACYGWNELKACKRNPGGIPVDSEIANMETHLADGIRSSVTQFLSQNKPFLERKKDLPMVLEGPRGSNYRTVNEKLAAVALTSEHAGYLEMSAVAYLAGIKFRVYEDKGLTFKLVAKIPSCTQSSSPADERCISILYHAETASNAGHYDLLTPFEDSNRSVAWSLKNESVNFGENVSPYTFEQILDPFSLADENKTQHSCENDSYLTHDDPANVNSSQTASDQPSPSDSNQPASLRTTNRQNSGQ